MKPVELLSDATVALKCPSCGAVYKPRPLAMAAENNEKTRGEE